MFTHAHAGKAFQRPPELTSRVTALKIQDPSPMVCLLNFNQLRPRALIPVFPLCSA